MREETLAGLVATRVQHPEAIAEAAAVRRRPAAPVGPSGHVLVIAADHPGRGSLRAGSSELAMADRGDLLDRLVEALARPGVTGVLGTADVLEDLLLLGALEGKAVFGSMNRGGLAGAAWEIDDRFTAYHAAGVEAMRWEGGKMLLRLDDQDPATARTLERCAAAAGDLAARGLVAMIEPFVARRVDGRLRVDLSTEAAIRASAIAAALGPTSAHTWLKVPVVDDMERLAAATTLPTVLLGGEVSDGSDATLERWQRALAAPNVIGLVVGRSLLYPPGDDVAAAVDAAAGLLGTGVAA